MHTLSIDCEYPPHTHTYPHTHTHTPTHVQAALETAQVAQQSLEEQLKSEQQSSSSLEEQLNAEREKHIKTLEKLALLEKENAASHVIDHVPKEGDHVIQSEEIMKPPPPSIVEDSLEMKYSDSLQSPFTLPPVTKATQQQKATPTSAPLHSTPTKTLESKHRNRALPDHIRNMLLSERDTSRSKVTNDTPYTGYSGVKGEGISLPEEALIGLRQAFDLINTLTSINVQLQDELARLSQENLVRLVCAWACVCVWGRWSRWCFKQIISNHKFLFDKNLLFSLLQCTYIIHTPTHIPPTHTHRHYETLPHTLPQHEGNNHYHSRHSHPVTMITHRHDDHPSRCGHAPLLLTSHWTV